MYDTDKQTFRGTIARIIFPRDRRLVFPSVSSLLRYRSFRAICAPLFVSRARPRAPEVILGNVILEEIARFARTTRLGLPGQAIQSFHVLRGTREFGNSPVFLYVKLVTSTFWRWPFGILFSRNSTGICISIFPVSFTLLLSNIFVSLKSVRFFSFVILYHHITSSSLIFFRPKENIQFFYIHVIEYLRNITLLFSELVRSNLQEELFFHYLIKAEIFPNGFSRKNT